MPNNTATTQADRRPPLATRDAYTLIELLVATASTGVLMTGLASGLYVATQALKVGSTSAGQAIDLAAAAEQMVGDLRHATSFAEITPTAVTFNVPDRDGDSTEETLRYAWSGVTGDPLTLEYNGASPIAMAAGVTSLNLSYLQRLLESEADGATQGGQVTFQEFTEQGVTTFKKQVEVATPPGAAADDLLIACVAVDGNFASSLSAPAGWDKVHIGQRAGSVTLGVWTRLATSSEPAGHTFQWNSDANAYGWIMRFDGHDPAAPLGSTATAEGSSIAPLSPAVTTSVDNCMVVRIGGFDNDRINTDATGVAGYTTITMDAPNTIFEASGGAAYANQAVAGDAGDLSFLLTGEEEFVTVTLAIQPEPQP
ncbi:MAG: hypothetical protein AAF790_10220 [Planctomycetota bacterium]